MPRGIIVTVLVFFASICNARAARLTPEQKFALGRPVACKFPSDKGRCEYNLTRYFYNARTRFCSAFLYGGCDGNGNNFNTLRDCRIRCGKWYNPKKDICLDPPLNIWCPYWPTFSDMWYFDYEKKQCVMFLYNGCTNDQNVFSSCLECKKACQRHMKTLQTCPGENCTCNAE
ncbi:BPTI/Kunitz domain-containing protein-like isoform X1 [Rhipicephalus microplus]|uniref:BPTI/Kunitz domain-containing protein-like isoform X1 n=1 Tax=Rhipicephalus microplus TaxID=6941 RepID=UPI003F6AC40D